MAPMGPLTVAVSLTDVPGSNPDAFGFEVVATVGVAGRTSYCTEPNSVTQSSLKAK